MQACGIEPLVLLVLGDQDFAALVAAFFGARLLVLDVVTRHPDLDESTDEISNVRVAAMPRIGVGDDERTEVDFRGGSSLVVVHLGAGEVLVLVGGEEGANQAGRFVRDLAERVARKVRTGVLRLRPLCRGRPAAEVDGFDPHALHHHRLAG